MTVKETSLIKEAERYSLTSDEVKSNADIMFKQAKPVIEDIIATTKEMDNELSSMPVHAYIDNFLHLHLGFSVEGEKYTIEDWFAFSGGPYREVLLLDGNNKVVAVVPSIYPKDAHRLLQDEAKTQQELDNTLGQKLTFIRMQEDNYKQLSEVQRQKLLEDTLNTVDDDVIEAHKKKWREFFLVMGLSTENIDKYAKSKFNIDMDKLRKEKGLSKPTEATSDTNTEDTNPNKSDNPFIF